MSLLITLQVNCNGSLLAITNSVSSLDALMAIEALLNSGADLSLIIYLLGVTLNQFSETDEEIQDQFIEVTLHNALSSH